MSKKSRATAGRRHARPHARRRRDCCSGPAARRHFRRSARISPDYYCTDGTIPRAQLPLVLKRIKEMSAKYGLRVANVFHAGDGNLHPLILYDANVPGELAKTEEFGAEILKLCVEVGGVLTGEHGVGVEKRDLMPTMFSEIDLDWFPSLRAALRRSAGDDRWCSQICSAVPSAASTASCIISLNVGCGKMVCASSARSARRLRHDIALDQFRHFRADHMRAEQLAGVGIEHGLDQAVRLAQRDRLAVADEREACPTLILRPVALALASVMPTRRHLRPAIGAARHIGGVQRMHAFHAGDASRPRSRLHACALCASQGAPTRSPIAHTPATPVSPYFSATTWVRSTLMPAASSPTIFRTRSSRILCSVLSLVRRMSTARSGERKKRRGSCGDVSPS